MALGWLSREVQVPLAAERRGGSGWMAGGGRRVEVSSHSPQPVSVRGAVPGDVWEVQRSLVGTRTRGPPQQWLVVI